MSMKIRVIPLLAVCSALATFNSFGAAETTTTTQTTTQPAANALPPEAAPAFSGRIPDVVTLAKSGVDESVVLAFIRNSPGPFQPSADEVIRLRDAGLSSGEISAMLERGAELRDQAVAATAATQQMASQAPEITEQAPANADTGGYATQDTSQPGSTVVYAGGGDNGGYWGNPYWWGYPSTFFVGGFISTPFFFPFPCFFHGTFFPHGCFFPHGGFVHGGFHGSFHDSNGFHSGFHGTTAGFRGGSVSGFRGGSVSGFRGGSVSGFRGASVSGFRGATVSGFRGATVSGFRGATVSGFRGAT